DLAGMGAPGAEGAPPVAARDGGVVAQTSFSTVAWGGRVRVGGAHRLRLHLARVELPAGTRLWVHGNGRTVGPFGGEVTGPDGGLGAPSVEGEELALDLETSAGGTAGSPRHEVEFVIDAVLELVPGAGEGAEPKDTSCEIDASCRSNADFPGYDA